MGKWIALQLKSTSTSKDLACHRDVFLFIAKFRGQEYFWTLECGQMLRDNLTTERFLSSWMSRAPTYLHPTSVYVERPAVTAQRFLAASLALGSAH